LNNLKQFYNLHYELESHKTIENAHKTIEKDWKRSETVRNGERSGTPRNAQERSGTVNGQEQMATN
jgi:hypothetical protein